MHMSSKSRKTLISPAHSIDRWENEGGATGVMSCVKMLVLGIGNLLLGDEGAGVHAARSLMEDGCPSEVTALDFGTAVLDVPPELEEADLIIVLDAVKGDCKPGTVYRMPLAVGPSSPRIASMHGFDLSRVLALARRSSPPEVIVIGVEPERIEWSLELSSSVAGAIPAMLKAVLREISKHGVRS